MTADLESPSGAVIELKHAATPSARPRAMAPDTRLFLVADLTLVLDRVYFALSIMHQSEQWGRLADALTAVSVRVREAAGDGPARTEQFADALLELAARMHLAETGTWDYEETVGRYRACDKLARTWRLGFMPVIVRPQGGDVRPK